MSARSPGCVGSQLSSFLVHALETVLSTATNGASQPYTPAAFFADWLTTGTLKRRPMTCAIFLKATSCSATA